MGVPCMTALTTACLFWSIQLSRSDCVLEVFNSFWQKYVIVDQEPFVWGKWAHFRKSNMLLSLMWNNYLSHKNWNCLFASCVMFTLGTSSSGAPEEYTARLDVEIDSARQGGSFKLWTLISWLDLIVWILANVTHISKTIEKLTRSLYYFVYY